NAAARRCLRWLRSSSGVLNCGNACGVRSDGMTLKCRTHIFCGATDKTSVTVGGGEDGELSRRRQEEEANIRWLLAAVLHHQPQDEPEPAAEASDDARSGGDHSPSM